MSYEESYAKAFPFDRMIPGMLDLEMIEDTVQIMNEAIKDPGEPHYQQPRLRQRPPDRSGDRRPAPFGEAAEAVLN
jgi:hypothetical protein